MAFRNEDRVIAKAFGAGGLACDSAIADAVIESAMAIGIDQAQDTTKTSGALPIGYVFHLFQQFFQILLVIGADSGKTGGIDARLSIKRIDFQARVVSEHPALFGAMARKAIAFSSALSAKVFPFSSTSGIPPQADGSKAMLRPSSSAANSSAL